MLDRVQELLDGSCRLARFRGARLRLAHSWILAIGTNLYLELSSGSLTITPLSTKSVLFGADRSSNTMQIQFPNQLRLSKGQQ